MNLGRGFKYFLQTGATRFPETNLDLYSPRRLSTVDVIDIVSEHSYRSIASDSEPESSSSQLGTIVEDTSVTDEEEQILETLAKVEDEEIPEKSNKNLKEDSEDVSGEEIAEELAAANTDSDDDDESWTSFFKTKEEDKLKLEVKGRMILFRIFIFVP